MLAAGAVLVLVVAVGWLAADPVVRWQVERTMTGRSGLPTTVAEARVLGDGLVLEGITVGAGADPAAGDGLGAEVDRVRIYGNLWSLATRRLAGLDSLWADRPVLLLPATPARPAASGSGAAADTGSTLPMLASRLRNPEALAHLRNLISRLPRSTAHGTPVRLANARILSREEHGTAVVVDHLDVFMRNHRGRVEMRGTGRPAAQGDDVAFALELDCEDPTLVVSVKRLPLAAVAPALAMVPWHRTEEGEIDADVEISLGDDDRLVAEGAAEVRDVNLQAEALAPAPIEGLDIEAGGTVAWSPDEGTLSLEDGSLALDSVAVAVAGTVHARTGRAVAVSATVELPPTPAQDIREALTPHVLGELAAFEADGELEGRVRADLVSSAPESTRLDLSVTDRSRFTRTPSFVDAGALRTRFTYEVYQADGTWGSRSCGPTESSWTPLSAISPFLIHAILAHEDAAFLRHEGFAPWAVEDAVARNLEEGRFAYGASTITMQLARNLYLRPDKNVARKVQEVLIAWWLEESLGKEEILALYLNIIEYGPGIYGIAEASRHYFGREPGDLGPAESAFLATILPQPRVYHRQRAAGELWNSTSTRMRVLLRHMERKSRIDSLALVSALAEVDSFRFVSADGAPAPHRVAGQAGALPFATAPQRVDEGSWLREPRRVLQLTR